MNLLSRGGRYVIYGAAHYMSACGDKPNWLMLGWKYLQRPKLDPMQLVTDNRSVMGFNLIWMWDKLDEMEEMLSDMMTLGGPWQPPHVGKVFDFCDVSSALRFLQSGRSIGKVVLKVKHN